MLPIFMLSILMGMTLVLSGCTGPMMQHAEQESTPEGEASIKVGIMFPLSGDVGSYGEDAKRAVMLAKQDAGLDNVELIFEDSTCDSTAAVSAASKLISVDKVQVIIGEMCSGPTLAAAPVAEGQHVVLVSPSATSPDITDAGDYVFRTIPTDAEQGDFGARLVYDKGFRKLAVLYSMEDYGTGFKSVLDDVFPALGGEIVASETFARGDLDLRTQLSKIKFSGADALYIITNAPDSAVAALKQVVELGMEQTVFMPEALKSDQVLNNAAGSAEGVYFTTVSSGSEAFLSHYKEMFGIEPGTFAAQSYDAYTAVSEVLKQGARSGEEIKDALYDVSFQGATGHIDFDANGDVGGNYEVYVVEDGTFVKQ